MKIFDYIPYHIRSQFKRKCRKCNTVIGGDDVIALGLRKVRSQYCLYIEHRCKQCKWREITVFSDDPMSVEHLCYLILNSMQNKRAAEIAQITEQNNSKIKKSISDDEVRELLHFINNNSSYQDFMKFIGADKFEGLN